MTYTQQEPQSLMGRFSQGCTGFGLAITLKKKSALVQTSEALPIIIIDEVLRNPVLCWPSQYVHSAQAAQTALAGLDVHRMNDGRIPKRHPLYGELASGKRTTERPRLRYKDVCMRDMEALDTDAAFWQGLAADHTRSPEKYTE